MNHNYSELLSLVCSFALIEQDSRAKRDVVIAKELVREMRIA